LFVTQVLSRGRFHEKFFGVSELDFGISPCAIGVLPVAAFEIG
jgi:hypothetical protein